MFNYLVKVKTCIQASNSLVSVGEIHACKDRACYRARDSFPIPLYNHGGDKAIAIASADTGTATCPWP